MTDANKESLALGYKATIISSISDVALAALKFAAGTLGHSSALIADALHSLTDLATDFVSFVSLKISHQKPDEDHPYGHGRAETIGTAVIGIVVVIVGLWLSWEQVIALEQGHENRPTWLAAAAAAASMVIKEAMYWYTLAIGKKARSESVIANAYHHRSDSLSSLAALIGIGGATLGYHAMDPLAAIIVGLMIIHMGGKITWDATQNLMDSGLSREELEELNRIIEAVPNVLHHHDIKTRRAGRDVFIDCHIQVSPRISVSEAHNIAETVRHDLRHRAPHVTDAMVHIDSEDDSEGGRLYNDQRVLVEKAVTEILAQSPDIRLAEDIILHYFLKNLAVDITLESDDEHTLTETRQVAARIKEKLFETGIVTEANIKHHLGIWKKTKGQPSA